MAKYTDSNRLPVAQKKLINAPCRHCQTFEAEHLGGKCLFGPTAFDAYTPETWQGNLGLAVFIGHPMFESSGDPEEPIRVRDVDDDGRDVGTDMRFSTLSVLMIGAK